MAIFHGKLEKAALETLSAAPVTGVIEGRIYYDTTLDAIRIYDGGAWRTVADLDSAQTFSGKTISGASNTLSVRLANDVTGTLPIGSGGTGQVSANASLNALLPTQTGQANKVLSTNGTDTSWAAVALTVTATRGDMIRRGSSADEAFTLGTRGKVLKAGASDPSWSWGATNAVSSADYTVTDSDGYETILVTTGSSDRTITLPAAANNTGRTIRVKKVDSGTGRVLVDQTSSETLDGSASTFEIIIEEASATFQSDGTGWHTLSIYAGPYGNFGRVRVHTSGGYGSTGTMTRRFNNNVVDTGTGIAFDNSATNGASFTVMKNGIYAITYFDNFTIAAGLGITLNAASTSTSIFNAGSTALAMSNTTAAGDVQSVSWTGFLVTGDVIRPQTDGTAASNAARVGFSMYRIA